MNDNKLDNIFEKTFSQKGTTQEDDNWDEFEIKLHKKMFYKFSWTRFNVYYMSMIFTCFFASSILVLNEYFKSISNTQNNATQTQVVLPNIDSSASPKEKIGYKQNQTNKYNTKKQDTLTKDSSTIVITPSEVKDTLASQSQIMPHTPVVMKRKKTVYL
ncbi:MAG TPA: hypothetical protein VNW06_06890, partial [Cytophagaceae bacterium]|nr:hypothetical protein [Cytophagaceae bacterium]